MALKSRSIILKISSKPLILRRQNETWQEKVTAKSCCPDPDRSSIGANESIAILKEIAAQQDKSLADALAGIGDGAQGSHHIAFSGGSNSGFQLRHNSGSISGFTFGKGG